jgi:hypothetical protein
LFFLSFAPGVYFPKCFFGLLATFKWINGVPRKKEERSFLSQGNGESHNLSLDKGRDHCPTTWHRSDSTGFRKAVNYERPWSGDSNHMIHIAPVARSDHSRPKELGKKKMLLELFTRLISNKTQLSSVCPAWFFIFLNVFPLQ